MASPTRASSARAPSLSAPQWIPLRTILVLLLLTGLLYPLAITALAWLLFRDEARGSVIVRDGLAVGSRLVGQEFRDPGRFWSRPSATGPIPYVAFDRAGPSGSSGSNLAPSSTALAGAVAARIAALRAADLALGLDDSAPIPVDLVTASASGLDPHLSVAGVRRQIARVAAARGIPIERLVALVEQHVERAWLGVLGEPVVNVLLLNLDLDSLPGQGR